ncbi:hypothetical protein OIDMADRAFT_189550 [Oidiodendron maius Zn]|uniref:trimethyllysine dioxygenase n=1 Tax=Oidiodendron maius (strain Zn) TaxID=913774 RepID=A0A0C3DUX3_OIDMZ|nr:hypothetical protein OIDMADRAFT_189550 [Oidiodendron maius Zn]
MHSRDHCRCQKCVNQDTMQRAFDTFQITPDVEPKEVVTERDGLRVTWGYDGISDGHVSLYPWEWLKKQGLSSQSQELSQENLDLYLWDKSINLEEPVVHYDEIMSHEKGVGEWTAKIRKYGFCYVEGCPVSPEKTERLLERIAFIRITHYGGFYDFTSDLTMKDMAYTSLALGAHTDTTYFTDPAGLQMFHLLSHTEGTGGASLLVDGFNAAHRLRQESPESWDILRAVPILWHASGNEGITITPSHRFPVLGINSNVGTGSTHGIEGLLQIRWNNDDRGLVPVRENDPISATKWYEAARKFDAILKEDDMQYWAQLKPGRPLIFDNWRVLHGRSAFSGKRRICGGYVNHDDFISRWRNTNFPREVALSQIL